MFGWPVTMLIALYCNVANNLYCLMSPDFFGQLSIQDYVSFRNMPTYVCQSIFMSV